MKKIVIVIVVILVSAFTIVAINKVLSKDLKLDNQNNASNNEEVVEKFNDKEREIINLIYDKLDILQYFNQDNLKSFYIKKMFEFGYFESKSNVRYLQVNYEFECSDGTKTCNNLIHPNYINEGNSSAFMIKIDLEDNSYIEKIPGFSTSPDSDWIQTIKRIEW